ncbi:carboxylesterase family protein [Sphingomonas rhizophila]|uniref:Carboxylic ester hydrolase n=1 Tax=Sphingomonas rhizophila TaxID=2071607 RepID=A0A7G9SBD0_9SPHN|nr:carboxylesterase family protein [Sphingomonas rhizophila]QNN65155.1 carboxylesterase family protein [Sphingomonas rhizophila]
MLRFLFLSLSALISTTAHAQVVQTASGQVQGSPHNGGVIFRGIPFAAPPIGALRWRAPQAAVPWTGVRAPVAQPKSCLQNDYGWNRGDFLIGSEDCLTLDVRTPSLTGKRAVLVWIHGGSNRAGGPNDIVTANLGPDIVVVGVRYRLGIFGFLSHRQAAAEGGGASGNYGLMDQIAALQWVNRNIPRFGGDPARVTIAGESAGSQDTSLLLASPAARGLFAQAIMESGTPGFGLPFRPLEDALRLGDQLDWLMASGGDILRLREMSAPALLAADKQLHDDALEADDYLWLRTTIDGRVLPASPDRLLRTAPPRPVIVGSNALELDLPGGRVRRDAFIAKAFGRNDAFARSFYKASEPDPEPHPRLGTLDQQIATDVTFRCPAGTLSRLLAATGSRVWRYEFDAAPGGGRTTHALEIGYAFGDRELKPGLSLKPYWVNFITTGNPNGRGLPEWPRFDGKDRKHVLFDADGATIRGDLRPEICSKLERL